MDNPFVTLFLWEIGSIVFLSLELYNTFYESISLQKDINRYNDEGKLNSSSKVARDISLDYLMSSIWFGSILTGIFNSLIITFELFDPIAAIISGLLPVIFWLIYGIIIKYKNEINNIRKTKKNTFIIIIQIKKNLLYLAISVIIGQMWYFVSQISSERQEFTYFEFNGLLPIAYGILIGLILLNVGEKIVPYSKE
jgi:hypothetical protein